MSFEGPKTYAFNAATGATLWEYSGSPNYSYGLTTSYYDGNLYIRGVDVDFGQLIGSSTGTPGPEFHMDLIPAFGDGLGFFLDSGTLTAREPATLLPAWSASNPADPFSTAPIIANHVIYECTYGGSLNVFAAKSGNLLGTLNLSDTVSGSMEANANWALGGLASSQNLVVIPTDHMIVAVTDQAHI